MSLRVTCNNVISGYLRPSRSSANQYQLIIEQHPTQLALHHYPIRSDGIAFIARRLDRNISHIVAYFQMGLCWILEMAPILVLPTLSKA